MVSERLPARYWVLWGASTTSNLADGVIRVGFPLVAVQLTRSPALVAGVTVALTVPWLVATLPAGAVADRMSRRSLLLGATTARAVVLGVVSALALASGADLLALYLAAVALGVAETVFDTTSQSVLPSLVEPRALSRANGRLHAAQVVTNEFAGAPLAGALVGVAATSVLLAPSGMYALAAVLLWWLPKAIGSTREEGDARGTIREDIVEGLLFLWRHRLLRTLAVMVATMNLASAAFAAVFVLYGVAPGPMGLSELHYGTLIAALAVGGIVGSLVVEPLERQLGRLPLLVAGVLGQIAIFAVPLATPNAVAVTAAFLLGGGASMWWNVVTVSLRQRISPLELLGRVNASYRLLAWGTLPLGAALGGLLGESLGVRAVFAGCTAVTVLLLPLFRTVTESAITEAEGAMGRRR